jgi:probable HAF family extracellular repeat protein/YD repeat-containing protein
MSMTSTARTTVGRRLGVLIAGSLVVTALTAGTAAASVPTPMGIASPGIGLRDGSSSRPRTPVPGFLLERGRYTRFDAPGAVQQTNALGINNRGVIVGKYTDAAGVQHGFRRDTHGRFTTIDVPGAAATHLNKLNDRGQIVGRDHQSFQPGDGSPFRGILLDGDRLVRIDGPGARQTQALGINNRGQVVGEYQTPDGKFHGFRWERGRITTIDAPGAAGTSLTDINDRGQILGARLEPDGTGRGFVLDRGRFVTFRAPDAPLTFPYDLNNRGQIVGYALAPTAADPLAGARGFLLAKGARGPLTPIDVPGAPRNAVTGLNDRGQLVGFYENSNAAPTPPPTGRPPVGRMA